MRDFIVKVFWVMSIHKIQYSQSLQFYIESISKIFQIWEIKCSQKWQQLSICEINVLHLQYACSVICGLLDVLVWLLFV